MTADQLEHQITRQPADRTAAVRQAVNDTPVDWVEKMPRMSFEHLVWKYVHMWPIKWAIRVQVDDSWMRNDR